MSDCSLGWRACAARERIKKYQRGQISEEKSEEKSQNMQRQQREIEEKERKAKEDRLTRPKRRYKATIRHSERLVQHVEENNAGSGQKGDRRSCKHHPR